MKNAARDSRDCVMGGVESVSTGEATVPLNLGALCWEEELSRLNPVSGFIKGKKEAGAKSGSHCSFPRALYSSFSHNPCDLTSPEMKHLKMLVHLLCPLTPLSPSTPVPMNPLDKSPSSPLPLVPLDSRPCSPFLGQNGVS